MFVFTPWLIAISSRCITCHRCLLSTVTWEQHAYCRNFETVIARIKSIKLLTLGVREIFGC